MILRPVNPPPAAEAAVVPAWDAVFETQRQSPPDCWLITQPDHATLAGDLAVAITAPWMPQMTDELVRGIAIHDSGWTAPDREMIGGSRAPRSFIDAAVPEFIAAWRASIEAAEQLSPLGGVLVSRHFSRLGQARAQTGGDSPEDERRLWQFLSAEEQRRRRLTAGQPSTHEQVLAWVEVLQFCDLLSLYLCCGSRRAVEFPQAFKGRRVRLWPHPERIPSDPRETVCRLEPSPFSRPLSLAVEASRRAISGDTTPVVAAVPVLIW